jgi:hypothetical protein
MGELDVRDIGSLGWSEASPPAPETLESPSHPASRVAHKITQAEIPILIIVTPVVACGAPPRWAFDSD